MECCGNRCMTTLNNDKDKGDPMENGAELGIHRGNTELGNENDDNVEGESEAMLWH